MNGLIARKSERRFWSKVDRSGECWLWTSGTYRSGYGRFFLDGKRVRAHRFAYEITVGPIPDGLVLDHLCRNIRCVRPEHLEAVTQYVNIMRGRGWGAANAAKERCSRGHVFLPRDTNGKRKCRTCAIRKTICPLCGKKLTAYGMGRHYWCMHRPRVGVAA